VQWIRRKPIVGENLNAEVSDRAQDISQRAIRDCTIAAQSMQTENERAGERQGAQELTDAAPAYRNKPGAILTLNGEFEKFKMPAAR
jgi:hypothetical protein